MVINSLFPVFALLVTGRLLKSFGLTNDVFLKQSDKLIYFFFFPILLFWKIGGAQTASGIPWDFIFAMLITVGVVYLVSAICIRIFHVGAFQAGTFSQSAYRFNTYIGMAVIMNALGDEGVRHFGIMVGMIIPVINFLAVSTLIWYSGKQVTKTQRITLVMKAIITNPLILSCIAGILYARLFSGFPKAIDNTLALATAVTLPLALFSIGGGLTLSSIKGSFGLCLVSSCIKLVIFPATGYYAMKFLDVDGTAFAAGMIFCALPASTAMYVLSSQLGSDTRLASASIAFSTLFSFVSLTVVLSFIVS